MKRSELLHPTFSFMGRPCNEAVARDLAYELIKEGSEEEREIGDFMLDWLSSAEHLELFTSGSTGKPKKIRVAKANMVQSALATGRFFELQVGQKILLCLPVDYIAGKMMLVRAMVLGLDAWYVPPVSDPLSDLQATFDFVAMVPKQLKSSLNDLHKVRTVIVGGAPVNADLAAALPLKEVRIYETFGMTETLTHIALRQLNTSKSDPEPFKALPGVSLGQDNRGCLLIKAPFVHSGELQTNDVVELLDESTFYWLGRFDHVINSGGVKLFPEQIEAKIKEVLGQSFFVAGLPDPDLGEQLVLVVETGQTVQALQALLDKVPGFKRYEKPKKIVTVSQFHRTSAGKIRRKMILQELFPET
ncbi:AMP-binding protein [Zeaxanthinibacter sp. PT1]|uniref:AMP-binding protein n=1 Tax=Zeaxanthinibacter TaxID=561554 RepID=UPI00234AC2E3|nr:AMP-binding protein [Zeaxanthinibacter sp. PT1]MDC6351672.1 AMP-binding protein [Zeaxanthinibacter sp. PT1]